MLELVEIFLVFLLYSFLLIGCSTVVFTFLRPIDDANPTGKLKPLSKGNGIYPWLEISILIPASGVKELRYSSCSMFISRFNPEK